MKQSILPAAVPAAPKSLEETGLSFGFIADLALKCIYHAGEVTGQDVANSTGIPFFNIIEKVLRFLLEERLCEVKKGTSYVASTWQYVLTDLGRTKVAEINARNAYSGPAPVSLGFYSRLAKRQSPLTHEIHDEDVAQALADLVINRSLLEKLGPAVNSGTSIFLYGPPGNGKTSIAERIRRMFGGSVWMPYAIEADGEVIRVFDPSIHRKQELDEKQHEKLGACDERWVLCDRPLVVVGGELTLAGLDLAFDPNSKFYTAPIQVKANGGVLLIDDFGRQQVQPRDLLNRWIVPLEKREDYLTLRTGKQVVVPFEELVIFSTNIEPRELVDEAFLRRIRYKIAILDPTPEEFKEIFRRYCHARGIEYVDEVLSYLIRRHYTDANRPLRSCHPRDIVDQIIDRARFQGAKPALTRESMDQACATYFVEL